MLAMVSRCPSCQHLPRNDNRSRDSGEQRWTGGGREGVAHLPGPPAGLDARSTNPEVPIDCHSDSTTFATSNVFADGGVRAIIDGALRLREKTWA